MRGIYQHAAGMPQSYLVQAIDKGIAGAFLDKTAKRNFCHDLLVVIIVHVLKGLFYTPAIMGKQSLMESGV